MARDFHVALSRGSTAMRIIGHLNRTMLDAMLLRLTPSENKDGSHGEAQIRSLCQAQSLFFSSESENLPSVY